MQDAKMNRATITVLVYKAGVETDSLATTLMNASYKDCVTVGQIVRTQKDRMSASAKADMLEMESIAKVRALKKPHLMLSSSYTYVQSS